jgi:hypothetical protein
VGIQTRGFPKNLRPKTPERHAVFEMKNLKKKELRMHSFLNSFGIIPNPHSEGLL